MMYILGIETSCDETAAAVVQSGTQILSNVVASQIKYHKKYGGVVPEIASRKHLENICWVIEQALDQAGIGLNHLQAIAVTAGPGLPGALLVGISIAKTLAYAQNIPLIACHHLEGHLYALVAEGHELPHPAIALIVSGGHSNIYKINAPGQYDLLGQTRDDAAGEAFDKVAKALKLGYPGGPIIDKLAKTGNPWAIKFPRSYLEKGSLDFSFSGIKTAVTYYLKQQAIKPDSKTMQTANVAASFQQAVVDVLVNKTILAAKKHLVNHILLTGGVACNSQLRRDLQSAAQQEGFTLHYPSPALCTDNAAMIASTGYFCYLKKEYADWSLDAKSNWPLC
jgi:N6-L-threonylcarbamoyladenine synthase